jgi:hypothetical protein
LFLQIASEEAKIHNNDFTMKKFIFSMTGLIVFLHKYLPLNLFLTSSSSYGTLGPGLGKPSIIVTSRCSRFLVQNTNRQVHMASCVLWNYGTLKMFKMPKRTGCLKSLNIKNT